MNIIKIVKNIEEQYQSYFYDSSLNEVIDHEYFNDFYTLNFYLQTLQKKFAFHDCLIVFHDKKRNSVDLKIMKEEIFLED